MEQLRLGIIGLGFRSPVVKLWHNPEGKSIITAVSDLLEDRIETFKKDVTSDVFATTDYKELLKRDDVDAVVVLTEDYKHIEHAVDVLEAGKDLYLEKPMAITIEDCDRIIDAWKKSNKKMMIGFNMRYMPLYETIKHYIDNDYIGEVKAVWVRHFVGRGGIYYYQDWHRNRKYTNSLLLQKASHDIDVIHMLTGSYVKKVSAFGSLDFYDNEEYFKADGLKNLVDDEIDVEDNNMLIMELENGVKASYLQNHFTPDYSRNYVVIGTKGRIESDDIKDNIVIKTRSTSSLHDMSDIEIKMKETDGLHAGADSRITKAFIDYIIDDVEPKASPVDGRMSVAVGIKATESLRNGGGVKEVPKYSN